jgi:hypothetical protein
MKEGLAGDYVIYAPESEKFLPLGTSTFPLNPDLV